MADYIPKTVANVRIYVDGMERTSGPDGFEGAATTSRPRLTVTLRRRLQQRTMHPRMSSGHRRQRHLAFPIPGLKFCRHCDPFQPVPDGDEWNGTKALSSHLQQRHGPRAGPAFGGAEVTMVPFLALWSPSTVGGTVLHALQ